MQKNLHKDLYSKKNKKIKYPTVKNISISPSDKNDYEIQENVCLSKKKYNRLAIFTTLIASGLIIFAYSFLVVSSQNEISLLSVDQNDTISEDSISSSTTTSTTTSSTHFNININFYNNKYQQLRQLLLFLLLLKIYLTHRINLQFLVYILVISIRNSIMKLKLR